MKFRYFLIAFLLCTDISMSAQLTLNANFTNIDFLASNRISKVGNGQNAGDVTLYTNAATISGQRVDCIVRTLSLTGGAFTLPGSAPALTTPFDYSSATGTGMTANQDRYFAPTFNFNSGGGNCRFRFEFILGNSYNNSNNTGTTVNIQNIYLNTYDIDGNGNNPSQQYNDFGGFSQTQLLTGAGSNVSVSYNTTTGLTRFQSFSNLNSTNVTADGFRVRIMYAVVSSLEIVVGSIGSGAAYFFLDFGPGPSWTNNPTLFSTPTLDLNTSTAGVDNANNACSGMTSLTSGTTNITSANTVNVDEITISYSVSEITDGNNEVLIPNAATPSNNQIVLNFTVGGTQTFSVGSIPLTLNSSVSGGNRRLSIVRTSGRMTKAEAETVLDALHYLNKKAIPTFGIRNFTVIIRENSFESPPTVYRIDVSCPLLPVIGLELKATHAPGGVLVEWSTLQEIETDYFELERSTDSRIFKPIHRKSAAGNSDTPRQYKFLDDLQNIDLTSRIYYRIRQADINGTAVYSKIIAIDMKGLGKPMLYNNPFQDRISIEFPNTLPRPIFIALTDPTGRLVRAENIQLSEGNRRLQINRLQQLQPGLYYLRIQDGQTVHQFTVLKQ
jgi:hypothetical protein